MRSSDARMPIDEENMDSKWTPQTIRKGVAKKLSL